MTIRTILGRTAFAVVCALTVAGPAAAAELWNVREGAGGSQGVWNLVGNDGGLAGSAEMFNPKIGKVRYAVSGSIAGGTYSFKRLASNDGGTCVYTGTRQVDGKIVGTVSCRDGSGPWVAQHMH